MRDYKVDINNTPNKLIPLRRSNGSSRRSLAKEQIITNA